MSVVWSSLELQHAIGDDYNIEIPKDLRCNIVHFNSNDVAEGDIFIALRGERSDGHEYVLDAIKNGAACVIVSKATDGVPKGKMIIVPDSLEALHKMAEYKRFTSNAKFIAVTGSSGKTSTKEALKTVLEKFGPTFASRGNFNNHIGVPLNMASLASDVKYAIFELGMNHSGEIRELTKIVKPDIAVITSIGEAHYEFFNSVEEIANAKSEIFEGLSDEGFAVVNFDGDYRNIVLDKVKQLNCKLAPVCKLTEYEIHDNYVDLKYLVYDQKNLPLQIKIGCIPKHQAENFSIVISIARVLDLDINLALHSLSKIEQTIGRGKILEVIHSTKKYKLLCDHYNANPQSMKASLEYFKIIPHLQKVLIIGDMLELGENSRQMHRDLIPYILDTKAYKMIFVGSDIKVVFSDIPSEIKKYYYSNVIDLIKDIENIVENEDFILIKGSNSIRLGKILDYFGVVK